MSLARIGSTLALVVLAGALVGGCGGSTLDTEEVETTVRETLEEQLGADVSSVECPDDVEPQAGASFPCEATGEDGTTAMIEIEQTSDEGDIRFEAPLLHTGEVEDDIAAGLADQLDGDFTVTCPDLVVAEEGTDLTCEAESDGDQADVSVTITDEEGAFEWELEG